MPKIRKTIAREKTTPEVRQQLEDAAPTFSCGFGPAGEDASNATEDEVIGEADSISALIASLGLDSKDFEDAPFNDDGTEADETDDELEGELV